MPSSSPVVHVDILGKMGNRMMQFMTAHAIARRVPDCRISNIDIPECNLAYEEIPEGDDYKAVVTYSQEQATAGLVDIENIATLLRDGKLKRVVLSGYCQHIANFGSPGQYASFFSQPLADAPGYGPDELLVNIRMGDIANGHHRDYILLPIEFYVEVIKSTGLRPIFLGQIEDNAYCRQLQAVFPEACFVNSRGAGHDFECIRRSKNIPITHEPPPI